ncbi:transmembrane protein, partial [Trifolium medium]|nr:transmembrane protein [Trifolium medium]
MASSSATTMKFFSFFLVINFAAVVASAQYISPSLAPAPSPDAGAAGSVTSSVAMIGASIV